MDRAATRAQQAQGSMYRPGASGDYRSDPELERRLYGEEVAKMDDPPWLPVRRAA